MTGVAHFVALFLAVLDPRNDVLEYAVAGIEPPLWYRAAEARVELLSRGGALLGVDPTAAYRTGILKLRPGDVVFAYSDGMIDEEDAEGDEFGLARLKLVARQTARAEAPTIVARLMASLEAHGSGEATDDRTLLVLKRSPEATVGMKSAAS